MKECKNCGEMHSSKSDYCQKVITKNCRVCGKEYRYNCRRRMPKSCSRICSARLRDNKCLTCGKPAIEKYCNEPVTATCTICGKEWEVKCDGNERRFCGPKCAGQSPEVIAKMKKTQIERYGAMGFNTQKQKDTMIERYGHEVPAKNEEIKEKIKETQYENNGGVFAFNTSKQKQTMLDKYGSYGRLGDPKELERQRQTMMERYGVNTPTEHPEFLEKSMSTLMERYGSIFNNQIISKLNREFAEKLEKELDVEVEFEYYIDGVFFDLYIPSHSIAIEINPTVTHNSTKAFACRVNGCDTSCNKHQPVSRTYHEGRAKIAMEHDIRLIQIYDWDDADDIFSLVANKIKKVNRKYSASKLNLEKIDQRSANKFLNAYHIQGGGRKQEYCYALKLDDEILAVATFSKSRFKSKAEWEFMRYAVKSGVIIHGGSTRLTNAFIREAKPKTIVSYIDFNHTTSRHTFLDTIGFKEVESTGPRLMYAKPNSSDKAVPMTSLLMIGADRMLGTNYGPKSVCGMDNHDIMIKEGYYEVWTAGNRVFIWTAE